MSRIITFGKHKGQPYKYLRYKPYWCKWFLGDTDFHQEVSGKYRDEHPDLVDYVSNITLPRPYVKKHCFSNMGKYEVICQGWDDDTTDYLKCQYNGFYYSDTEDNDGWLCKRCSKKKNIYNKHKRPPRILQPVDTVITDRLFELTGVKGINISSEPVDEVIDEVIDEVKVYTEELTEELKEELKRDIWDNCIVCASEVTISEICHKDNDEKSYLLCLDCNDEVINLLNRKSR